MNGLAQMFGAEPSQPRNRASAIAAAVMFQQLGGAFVIDAEGKRFLCREFEPVGKTRVCGLDHQGWDRVIGIMESAIRALHADDKAFLFEAYAICSPDPAKLTTDFAEPTRRVA